MTEVWHSPSTGFSSRQIRSLTLQTILPVQITKIKAQFRPGLKSEASSWLSFSKRSMILCAVYISPHWYCTHTPHIAEIQYEGMRNHSKRDVAALKWTYTKDKFILLYRINNSCWLLAFCYSNTFSSCKNAFEYLKFFLTKYSLAPDQASFPYDCEAFPLFFPY